jgi:hypothetical protein
LGERADGEILPVLGVLLHSMGVSVWVVAAVVAFPGVDRLTVLDAIGRMISQKHRRPAAVEPVAGWH